MTGSAEAYSPERVLILGVNLPAAKYPQTGERLAFYRKALADLSSLPGAQSVAAFSCYPLSNNGAIWGYFQVLGRVAPDLRHSPWADMQTISPEYLGLMHVALLAGREFTSDDREATQPVALVSQKLAQRYWPGESALGKQIRIGGPADSGPWLTVVGIYGIMAYTVGERTNEFGVRIAMGAEREDILWLASRHGLLISAAAFAIGLPAAIAGARFLAGLIYGTSPGDPVVFAGVPIILFAAVLTAGYIPAHRATRVDPLAALRYE